MKNIKSIQRSKKNKMINMGTLGGQIAELGYGNLEAAKNAIEDMYIWNQEELDMAREQLLRKNIMKKN